jgi:uncharacterized Zn-binding protein involved in type VI secretion
MLHFPIAQTGISATAQFGFLMPTHRSMATVGELLANRAQNDEARVSRTDQRVKISGLAICRLGTAHTHPGDLSAAGVGRQAGSSASIFETIASEGPTDCYAGRSFRC